MKKRIKVDSENSSMFDQGHCEECDSMGPISFDMDEREFYCKICLGVVVMPGVKFEKDEKGS